MNETKHYCDFCGIEILNRGGIRCCVLYTQNLNNDCYDYETWDKLKMLESSSESYDICNDCMMDEPTIEGGEYSPSLGLRNKARGLIQRLFLKEKKEKKSE